MDHSKLDQDIMNLIQDATRKMRLLRPTPFGHIGTDFGGKELTMSQMGTLGAVKKFGPIAMSKLAEELQITGASLSEHISALEQAGLVERDREQDDRRTVIVKLSEKGRNMFVKIMAHRKSGYNMVMSALTDEDKQDLLRLLTKIIAAVGKDSQNI